MKHFKLTFGTGKDSLVVETAGTDLMQMLGEMKAAGWEVENITKIVEQKAAA